MPKKRQGRALQLTTEEIDSIAAAVELGAAISAAVLSQGYSRRAYQRWERVGSTALEKAEDGKSLTPEENRFAEYVIKIRKAMGAFECQAAIRLREIGETDAETLRWLLTHREDNEFPDPKDKELAELRNDVTKLMQKLTEAEKRV